MVEKINHTLITKLRAELLQHPKRKWSSLLPQVTRAYNPTPHEVTGFTPRFLLYGITETPGYAEPPMALEEAREKANHNTRSAQAKRKDTHDSKHPDVTLDVGDKVLRKIAENHPSLTKLHPRQQGPFTVSKKWSDLTYELVNEKGKTFRAHISQLRPFKTRD